MPQRLHAALLPEGSVEFEWRENGDLPQQSNLEAEKHFLRLYAKHQSLFITGLLPAKLNLTPSLAFWRNFAALFTKSILLTDNIEAKKHRLKIPLSEDDLKTALLRAPNMVGLEYLEPVLLMDVWDRFHTEFRALVKDNPKPVALLFNQLTPNHVLSNRIHFHLVENKNSPTSPFAFMATYATDMGKGGVEKHVPLQYALKEFKDDGKRMVSLLSSIYKTGKLSQFIQDLLDSGEIFKPIGFTAKEAHTFLREVPLYEETGILCRIPRWWQGKTHSPTMGLVMGNAGPSRVGADALMDFQVCLHIGGERLTQAEIRGILSQYQGLAYLKGKWVAVETEKLKAMLEQFETAKALAKKHKVSLSEAMQLLMSGDGKALHQELERMEIMPGKWLENVMDKMANPGRIKSVKAPGRLRATLRPYQLQGLNWLHFLHQLGFGMCLADDMGLGKTLQVLALLTTLKPLKKANETSLLIVPASLMSNWQAEIRKFTPHLKIAFAHPQLADKKELAALRKNPERVDLLITTYGMVNRLKWLKEREWFYLILDEAQAIKNPLSKQTRAVKALCSCRKLVLTGTPIENRLADLWSLFDFINPGLLGGSTAFKQFCAGLNDNPDGYGKLRRIVHPYILRRLKTNKSIISDLPEKVEVKCFSPLSRHQTVLYRQAVDDLAAELSEVDGIRRRGIVLKYLIKFKQLCNHPDQFTGQTAYAEEESGKFSRLREICETVLEKRERMLVFTQFKEIIRPLDDFLTKVFARPGLTLHGQTSVKQRKERVTRFQSNIYIPYFILSVKAGGVGLNLTRANHVVHFDRWWNPAVENQATDRAFRIGQGKNVMVHKFICKGTLEERIDEMIDDKKSLSDKVLASDGEKWITEMDDRQLLQMFKLTI